MEGLGARIKKYRKEKGIQQEHFAEAIGISTNHLSALERDMYTPKLDTLIRIINALDCTADEILGDLIQKSYKIKTSVLGSKIALLPFDEQKRILAVVDTMIEHAKKY